LSLARRTGPALPGHEEALAQARNLAHVCAPRNLDTREIFEPNAFYGSDGVLKAYAGLPPEEPLKLVVPHGVVFDEAYVWVKERQACLPAVLAYGENRERIYRRATGKVVIRSAPPFAYAARLLEGEPAPQRSGTLFFPSHSTHRITWHADFDGLAEALLGLDGKFQPVTVCLYWRDYELGRHLPFARRGLPVVSAGHMFDPKFLFRLVHLCRAHAYAASNVLGSYLAYAVIAGCRFFFLHGFEARHSQEVAAGGDDISAPGETGAALQRAFAQPYETLGPQRAGLLARACDTDRVLAPEALRAALAMADRLDRVGIASSPLDGRLRFGVPYRFARAGTRAAQAGWRWLRASRARKAS
jgi:hypothetical protein